MTDDHMGEAMTEPCVTTRHAIDLPGGRLEYQARVGTVRVGRDDGSPLADVFYLAYRAESGATRPVTFAFNGGPGSASLWLNVGGFGPRRAPTLTPHATPPAPYAFGDNPHTLLAVSDLVFLDAVGTGFSRLAGDGRPDEVWGVDQDVEVFARAILRYLTMTGSWQAPRYLFGESYGTSRAAALVYRLQNLGADFNGVIMLSTLLNWATTQPGLDQGYVNLLPSYAAAAWYHGKARAAGQPLTGFLDGAREFAQGDYAAALQQGDRLPAATEQAVAARLADFTGLDVATLRRTKLRIEMEDFRRELLGQEGKRIGRFDARFCADHQYVIGTGAFDPAADDAATAGVSSAHLSGFHQHLAADLGYRSDLHYRPLNNVTIEAAWDWRHKAPGIDAPLQVPNVALDLSAAMRRNPALRVYIMGGVYDLATPFAGAEFDISHLYLGERLRRNVQFSWYESGHMTFVDEKVIPVMASDLARFYASPPDRAALGVEQAAWYAVMASWPRSLAPSLASRWATCAEGGGEVKHLATMDVVEGLGAEPRAPWGGDGAARGPTPDPARYLPWGSVAGLIQQHARTEACCKEEFLYSRPRALSCRKDCREHALGLCRDKALCRAYAGSRLGSGGGAKSGKVNTTAAPGRTWPRYSRWPRCVGGRREGCSRRLGKWNSGVR